MDPSSHTNTRPDHSDHHAGHGEHHQANHHHNDHSHGLLVLSVNEQPVRFHQGVFTGLQIKQTAIAQGVAIGLDFLLTAVLPNGEAHEIGDTDPVHVCPGTEFFAIPDDDNS